jgi:hypothetical protein
MGRVRKLGTLWRRSEMAEVKKMSEGLIDVAERFADVVDAAQGRGARKSGHGARWLILPAAGAGVYALATSSSALARRTRKLMSRAKDRATDLPDADLIGRVKEVTGTEQKASGTSGRTQSTRRRQTRRSGSGQTQRRRKTKSTA